MSIKQEELLSSRNLKLNSMKAELNTSNIGFRRWQEKMSSLKGPTLKKKKKKKYVLASRSRLLGKKRMQYPAKTVVLKTLAAFFMIDSTPPKNILNLQKESFMLLLKLIILADNLLKLKNVMQ